MTRGKTTLRRVLGAALAATHLALVLGTGFHTGPHLDPEIAWLPQDLHHHAYGFSRASPEPPHRLDDCVACQLSRLLPRLPAPPATLAALAAVRSSAPPAVPAALPALPLDPPGARAPPAS